MQFYVADGKYRKQVFALEDLQDGNLTVYCPDVLAEVAAAGLLQGPAAGAGAGAALYAAVPSGARLLIEPLDRDSRNPGDHFKDMTGWNRKALRVTLPPSASPVQVEAAELLCAIAARHFAAQPVRPPAVQP